MILFNCIKNSCSVNRTKIKLCKFICKYYFKMERYLLNRKDAC